MPAKINEWYSATGAAGAGAGAAAGVAGVQSSKAGQQRQQQQQGGAAASGKEGKAAPPPDERSWIQKNWIFLIPIGLLVIFHCKRFRIILCKNLCSLLVQKAFFVFFLIPVGLLVSVICLGSDTLPSLLTSLSFWQH